MTRKVGTHSNTLAALTLLSALVIGAIGGYAIGTRPGPQRLKQMSLLGISRATLLDSLGLRPDQRARIDSILDGAEQRAEGSIDRMMTEFRATTEDARTAVRAEFDPGQRERFDSLLGSALPLLPRSPLPERRPP